jgi:uncharacterized protein YcbX
MHLSGIFIYPVKSLRGIAVHEAKIDALGLIGDRRFLVLDQQGKFLTQRTVPRMALIRTQLTSTDLILSSIGANDFVVPLSSSPAPTRISVSVWNSEGLITDDCGEEAADWLSSALEFKCRLVRIGDQFRRPVLSPRADRNDVFAFADGSPFLLISEASVADLNDRLAGQEEDPVPMNRFRPNLVISGSSAFTEDNWVRLRIGGAIFRTAGPCERCIITTTDQLTGTRGKQPLRILATYRRSATDPTAVNFGQNLIHETKAGTVRVGDPVEELG